MGFLQIPSSRTRNRPICRQESAKVTKSGHSGPIPGFPSSRHFCTSSDTAFCHIPLKSWSRTGPAFFPPFSPSDGTPSLSRVEEGGARLYYLPCPIPCLYHPVLPALCTPAVCTSVYHVRCSGSGVREACPGLKVLGKPGQASLKGKPWPEVSLFLEGIPRVRRRPEGRNRAMIGRNRVVLHHIQA